MSSRYRTGDVRLDGLIAELVDNAGVEPDADLVSEMVVSALRMGREAANRGELKMVNAALKELRYSFQVFETYTDVRKCSIFGSARILPESAEYESARLLGEKLAEAGWMVITGAGPGIMAAGLEGAGAEHSFGVNILLPFESEAAPVIAGDPKLINFKYFFTRKIMFMKESSGFALLPGGFGTMDEAFELLTLIQTGRSAITPIVLIEPEGSSYWRNWLRFVESELAGRQLISPADLTLFVITGDVATAVQEITDFYRVYHSSRTVGRRLVLRLNHSIADASLDELNEEFADIVSQGEIERIAAQPVEVRDNDNVALDRLGLYFDRRSFGRLRQLIDQLNTCAVDD